MSLTPDQHEALVPLREYFLSASGPDSHLSPGWLAHKLGLEERELLGALAYAVRDGLVELHWEVYCPGCGIGVEEFDRLEQARAISECAPCELHFELHLDRDVRVTFSASERVRRERGGASAGPTRLEDESVPPTRGLDLLLVPAFREMFSGEAPALDESLRIGRVAMLFTDLKGSTAMYAERGDPLAYRLVRDHFAILAEAIERHRGLFIKTIGDAVMASFASGADAVRAAFESQTELHARAEAMGGELIIKAGVHAGACLSVRLNERLDFFGGAVNTAARVQGLSRGNDVVITDAVLADLQSEAATGAQPFQIVESFDAELRGLPAPIHIHRLIQ
jgi:class 3 adenylate cyclase